MLNAQWSMVNGQCSMVNGLSVLQLSIDHPAEVFGTEVAYLVLFGLLGDVLCHFLHIDVDVFVAWACGR